MQLEILDWIIIVGFFGLILGVGLSYTKQAGKDLTSFFLGGRNLPWYIAGISMVATTFAADTPLAVTELVGKNGIAGNWLWWSFLAGGMLTTFFFAKLWRKANVLTEVELIELRYSGIEASALRGMKALYLGIFMNVIIIAWVNVALMSLIEVFFEVDKTTALMYTAIAMLLVAIYASMSGLLGVAMTDVIQFVLAMTGCIVLAILVVNSDKIGGIDGLKEKLPDGTLDFFPSVTADGTSAGKTLGLSIGAFFAYVGVQWWASWYPGAEPGGGGYVAQRMMSAKSEKDAVYATLFFQIAHYCIRPWPWILVGLCAIVLYPDLPEADVKLGYVHAMNDFLPTGLKGLLLVAFFAAYMSTISTQLNWGSSYVINDFYKRFINPKADNKLLITASRICTFILMLIGLGVTTMIDSISGAWGFIMQCGAGLGLVLILRWYWWRINAWSEITATLAPFVAISALYFTDIEFPESFLITVVFTTIAWLAVTFMTAPSKQDTLQRFYNRVKPDGAWEPFKTEEDKANRAGNLWNLLICWLSAITLTYGILFLLGKLILKEWTTAGILAVIVAVSFLVLRHFVGKTNIFDADETEPITNEPPIDLQENILDA